MINRLAETKIHSSHLFATYDKTLSVRKSDISRIFAKILAFSRAKTGRT